MKSLFQLLTEFQGNDMDFEDLLSDLKLKFFDNLYAIYPTKERARAAVEYIVYAYSRDSYLVTSGESWANCKERAADKADLNQEQRNELVNFEFKLVPKEKKSNGKAKGKDEVDEIEKDEDLAELKASDHNIAKIIVCINAYLNHQNDKINRHLRRMYDLYEQLSQAAVNMKADSSGGIDWKQKIDNQNAANKLFDDIEIWEQKLEAKNANLRPAQKEIGEKKKIVATSLRPEARIA
jgi:hypothetical protein